MAKFEEADPRWLVEKREDGTNVNQYHWQEKDCLAWTRTRLGQLFDNLTLVSGASGSVSTTGVKSVEGDAILNVRKAKLIASYELAIRISWSGTTPDGAPGSGLIELPYVADENHDEDPEVKVVLPEETAASQALKAAILASGKQAICAAIKTYVSELAAGVPSQSSSSGGGQAQEGSNSSDSKPAGAAATAAVNGSGQHAANGSSAAAGKAKATASSKSRSTVKLTERFYARAQDIFECFVDQGRLQAFTRSPAVVEPQPGGAFRWFNGHVLGTFVELVPGQRIVMQWRFNNWEDDCFSKVVLELAEPEPGNTVLTLTQTGLPAEDKFGNSDVQQQVEAGWQEQVFRQIRQVFGFGV